jgi:hypothetical protein
MAFLTINGVDVSCEQGGETDPEWIGASTRAWDGTLRTSERSKKRKWKARSQLLLLAPANVLEAMIGMGAILPCTGDLFKGLTVSCQVKYSAVDNPMTFPITYQYQLEFREA